MGNTIFVAHTRSGRTNGFHVDQQIISVLPLPDMVTRSTKAAGGKTASVRPYELRISRLTIDKLGVKLYDKVSAVVAELIATG